MAAPPAVNVAAPPEATLVGDADTTTVGRRRRVARSVFEYAITPISVTCRRI